MSNKEKRLDPRVVRTRQMLRAALIHLIPQKGFTAITVGDITNQAMLNRATFYLHYRDKNELLMEAFEELIANATPLPPLQGLPTSEAAVQSIAGVFNHLARYADFFRVMLAEENVPVFAEGARKYIEEVSLKWISALQPNQAKLLVSPEIAINFLGAAYLGAIVWWLKKGMPYPAEHMARQLMRLTTLGLQRSLGLETPDLIP